MNDVNISSTVSTPHVCRYQPLPAKEQPTTCTLTWLSSLASRENIEIQTQLILLCLHRNLTMSV